MTTTEISTLTFPAQFMTDVAYVFGKPQWFDLPRPSLDSAAPGARLTAILHGTADDHDDRSRRYGL